MHWVMIHPASNNLNVYFLTPLFPFTKSLSLYSIGWYFERGNPPKLNKFPIRCPEYPTKLFIEAAEQRNCIWPRFNIFTQHFTVCKFNIFNFLFTHNLWQVSYLYTSIQETYLTGNCEHFIQFSAEQENYQHQGLCW